MPIPEEPKNLLDTWFEEAGIESPEEVEPIGVVLMSHRKHVLCPIHETEMYYSPAHDLYACQDSSCEHAGGVKAGTCWNCIKHRHGICDGRDDESPAGTGGLCDCNHDDGCEDENDEW